VIRRVTIDDIDVLRQTRLAALAESPASFGSTYAAEAALPHETWHERVTLAASGDDRVMFLALDGEVCIGLAGAMDDDCGADKQLISMWVAPSHPTAVRANGLRPNRRCPALALGPLQGRGPDDPRTMILRRVDRRLVSQAA
jgi:hypothetical protein